MPALRQLVPFRMSTSFYLWKKITFLRLLIPFIAGIILQWEIPLSPAHWIITLIISVLIIGSFFFIPLFGRFRLGVINGLAVNTALLSLGALLVWQKDIRNNPQWFAHSYNDSMALLVTLAEPTSQKTKSIKADAEISYLLKRNELIPATGKIILYFQKDSLMDQLPYGSQIIFKKPLQEIKNSGNPGGFDYNRYSLFHNITHQVFLKRGEFEILQEKSGKWLNNFLYKTREKILAILNSNIKSQKELGLAEALLIGYKNDLDKTLVQSYTNTGVVHIIAISGLHLGLIYWLLILLFKPLQKKKNLSWLRALLIITGLWLFSLLAGGQPSVLRSALMFSTIVLGETLSKKSNIYNSLAFSAFALLCYNPFWLWDVGFQLSYAAVLSIVIFMQPIYNWFYTPNKFLAFVWKLNAVTLAAQVLTLPVSIYHFHQFPSYFLLTNFIAVPLSSGILIGEIILCGVSFIPFIALFIGKILTWLIRLMNSYIEWIESFRFSLIDEIQISFVQTVLFMLFIAGMSYWLMEQKMMGLKTGLLALTCFSLSGAYGIIRAGRQEKIIVYNVPQKKAVDLIEGRKYFFIGDSSLLEDDFARNFHLKPARIINRTSGATSLKYMYQSDNYITYKTKKILLLDKTMAFQHSEQKPVIDLLILSENPRIYIKKLATSLTIRQVVVDGTVPAWKAKYWEKDCAALGIPYHHVTSNGAFVMNL